MNQITIRRADRKKARELEVPGWEVKDFLEILCTATNPSVADIKLHERGYGADFYQVFLPSFRKLYQEDRKFRRASLTELRTTGFKTPMVDAYFTSMSNQPYGILNIRHPRIPEAKRLRFIRKAGRVILTRLQDYFGFKR